MKMPEELEIERVQLGVRMEKRMVKVLKGLAEFQGVTLSQLLESIVLHAFEPMPGPDGEPVAASALGEKSFEAVERLKQVYGMDYETHASYRFREPSDRESAPS